MRRSSAFVLPMALVVLFILLVLLVALNSLGQTTENVFQKERREWTQRLLAQTTRNQLGLALSGDNKNLGPASLTQGFDNKMDDVRLSVKWGPTDSVNRPPATRWGNFDNLFNSSFELPSASFEDVQSAANKTSVPPGTALVQLKSNRKSEGLVAYSSGFPYAAYAPRGEIRLDSVRSWANPTFTLSKQMNTAAVYTGLPADVLAQGQIEVINSYKHGTAYSSQGPILLPAPGLGEESASQALAMRVRIPSQME